MGLSDSFCAQKVPTTTRRPGVKNSCHRKSEGRCGTEIFDTTLRPAASLARLGAYSPPIRAYRALIVAFKTLRR